MNEFLKKINVSLLFKITLLVKGVDGVLEIIGGFLFFLLNPQKIIRIVYLLTQHELSEDPRDTVANFLINEAGKLSLNGQVFAGFYLLSHGLIKIFLIIALLKRRLWAYPTAIVFFGLFIIYQIYRYLDTHSLWLVFLAILDFLVVILAWLEYRNLKARIQAPNRIS